MLLIEGQILLDQVGTHIQHKRDLAGREALAVQRRNTDERLHVPLDGRQAVSRVEPNLVVCLAAEPTTDDLWLMCLSATDAFQLATRR